MNPTLDNLTYRTAVTFRELAVYGLPILLAAIAIIFY